MITKNSNAKQAWAPTTNELQKKLQENEKELQLRELEKSRTKFQEILFENKDSLDLREFRKDDIWKKSEWYFYKEHSPDVVLPLVMRWAEGGALGPLATYMEASGVITDEVRNFLVRNLRGERAK